MKRWRNYTKTTTTGSSFFSYEGHGTLHRFITLSRLDSFFFLEGAERAGAVLTKKMSPSLEMRFFRWSDWSISDYWSAPALFVGGCTNRWALRWRSPTMTDGSLGSSLKTGRLCGPKYNERNFRVVISCFVGKKTILPPTVRRKTSERKPCGATGAIQD